MARVRAIEVGALTKSFGEVDALSGVDMVVNVGEVHGLLGPNGAGKSTLLRILFGLVRPDSGQAVIFGREHDVEGPAATLAGVAGFVDRPHFYPYLTARRTLELLAEVDGMKDAPIDEVLARTGLTEAAGRKVRGWSTGMLQRLGIACALLRRPRLLMLDEPTEGLDPVGARQLDDLLRSLASDGVTVLLSSHNMAEVDSLCDSATILHKGCVVRHGHLDELRASAPLGRHHLKTSDDASAMAIAAGYRIKLHPHQRGGLSVQAGPAELHDLVCDLGRRDVSVVALEQEVAPLTALFYQLTESDEELIAG